MHHLKNCHSLMVHKMHPTMEPLAIFYGSSEPDKQNFFYIDISDPRDIVCTG